MEKRKEIIIMHGLGTRPHEIAGILKIPEQTVEEAVCDYELGLENTDRHYQEHHVPLVQQAVKDLKNDIPEAERHEMRRRYLLDQLQELRKDPSNPKLKKVMLDIKIFTGKLQGISPDMIVRAREYPITELVKSNRGTALCPFHSDKHPSMDVRKNFYHCYSCGASGDIIDFVMKRDGLSFKAAVHRLAT